MISDILTVASGFQSSVNIGYDFNNIGKISGFIPTSSSAAVINSIISNTDDDGDQRAKILTGAYGRGKSHIVLVALSILYNKDKKLFKTLIEKIRKIDDELAQRIDNYVSSKRKLLPVIISGNSGSLSQSFLRALRQALNNYSLDDIKPETYFTAAAETVMRWKTDYTDTFKAFIKLVGDKEQSYISKLGSGDDEAFQKFIDIYPQLTAGAEFNPFTNADVVETYGEVNRQLKDRGYTGIYVVYDEFGKYLETSISQTSESDMKLLQDFAEKCNRRDEMQLHLMLICHKDISNYIDDGLPQDKVDGWRGISGRFEHLVLSNNFHQMYEIISCTIEKNEKKWNSYKKTNSALFEELQTGAEKKNFLSGKDELVVYGCYPLHPVTTFLLPRLSEKIAQNERTLFTFLTSSQKNTLSEFIENTEENFPLMTPDRLFDYFEQELKRELRSSELHKTYFLAANLLDKVTDDELGSKIIKAIAIIYCVAQFERVAPDFDTICDIYGVIYDRKEIATKIDELINLKYIVYRKSSNNFLCLKESSGIDIAVEIENRTNQLKNEFDLETALNSAVKSNFLYPVKHNEEKCLTRYFEFRFIDNKSISDGDLPVIREGACGTVYGVLLDKNYKTKNLGKRLSEKTSAILIIPDNYTDIENVVYRYLAAASLRDACAPEDSVLRSEYELVADDLESIVFGFVSQYTRPETQKATYYYKGKKQNILRRSALTQLLSDICDEVYPHTPIVNNESINKDKLPGVAVTSRSKLTTAILESAPGLIEESFGLTGTGQDVSFMRSTLMRTGILLRGENGKYYLEENCSDESIRYVLKTVRDFFVSTATCGEKSFETLYGKLMGAKDGIGMKKGSIPVYIAVVLHSIKDDLVFKSNGYEVKINSDTLNSINERPDTYSVLMENWDDNKRDYLNALEEAFSEHIIEKERSYNSFAYIAGAIDRWYLSLPKCSREMTQRYSDKKNIAANHKKFYNILRAPKNNPRDFLMLSIPKAFDAEEANSNVADSVRSCKTEMDNAKGELVNRIIKEIRSAFGGNERSSLKTLLTDWSDRLSDSTKQHMFTNNEHTVLSLISTVTNDENIFAERIAKAITGLRIDDWNYSVLEKFIYSLEGFKHEIEEYNAKTSEHNNMAGSECRIVTVNENGEEIVRSFNRVEYSDRAKLLFRDITGAISDMGQSITEIEKKQVLFEILEEMCK